MAISIINRNLDLLYNCIQSTDFSVKEFAKKYEVTERTIQYDLKKVKELLQKNKVQILKNEEMGNYISKEDKNRILVEFYNESEDRIGDLDYRLRNILISLICSNTYVTSASLSRELSVSLQTIKSDLKQLTHITTKLNISVKSEKGKGFIVVENIVNKKKFLFTILLKICDQYVSSFVYNNLVSESQEGLSFIKLTNLEELNKTFNQEIARFKEVQFVNNEEIKKRDSTFWVSLIVKNTVDRFFGTDKQKGNSPKMAKSCLVFDETDKINNLKIAQLIIKDVSETVNIPFSEDLELEENLYTHLFLNEQYIEGPKYNYFTDTIKKDYPWLFQAVLEATEVYLQKSNDHFVSLIVLHFLGSIERTKMNTNKVRVVYVCSTGIGVANYLRTTLQKKVKNIFVEDIISLFEFDEYMSKNGDDVDLVLSIFPLNTQNCECIKVEPFLDSEDVRVIQEKVNQILYFKMNLKEKIEVSPIPDSTFDVTNNLKNIYTAFNVFTELAALLNLTKEDEFRQSFLFHIVLCVARIQKDEQYQLNGIQQSESVKRNAISQVFNKSNLQINESEIEGILNYAR